MAHRRVLHGANLEDWQNLLGTKVTVSGSRDVSRVGRSNQSPFDAIKPVITMTTKSPFATSAMVPETVPAGKLKVCENARERFRQSHVRQQGLQRAGPLRDPSSSIR